MTMQFEGAKVTEQGVTFGIVIVKPHVLSSTSDQSRARSLGTRAFGRIPIILMAQDGRGVPTYQGRPDIVRLPQQDRLPADPLEEVHPLTAPEETSTWHPRATARARAAFRGPSSFPSCTPSSTWPPMPTARIAAIKSCCTSASTARSRSGPSRGQAAA